MKLHTQIDKKLFTMSENIDHFFQSIDIFETPGMENTISYQSCFLFTWYVFHKCECMLLHSLNITFLIMNGIVCFYLKASGLIAFEFPTVKWLTSIIRTDTVNIIRVVLKLVITLLEMGVKIIDYWQSGRQSATVM